MTGRIALLVPCYNAGRHLPRLIAAVRESTRPFDEILCYDDGSSDDTVAVARNLGLRVIEGKCNRGVAHARNRLAAAAETEWIHFHDADDWIAPGFLEQLGPWCGDGHDVVSCDADWVDDATGSILIRWRYDSDALARAPHAHLLACAMGLNSSIIRLRSWLGVGGCDESLAMWEDADVHIRLARAGARFKHVNEVLTRSLRRQDSFSHDYRRNWNCRLSALERYAAAPGNVRQILIAESENAAAQLALLGDVAACRRAVGLCRQLGGNPPTSRHLLIRLLKPVVPAHVLLQWQARRRSRAVA